MNKMIKERLSIYKSNLNLARHGTLIHAQVFIQHAIEFLEDGQLLEKDDEKKLKNLYNNLIRNQKHFEALKISAQLNENYFVRKIIVAAQQEGRNGRRY